MSFFQCSLKLFFIKLFAYIFNMFTCMKIKMYLSESQLLSAPFVPYIISNLLNKYLRISFPLVDVKIKTNCFCGFSDFDFYKTLMIFLYPVNFLPLIISVFNFYFHIFNKSFRYVKCRSIFMYITGIHFREYIFPHLLFLC